MRKASHGMAGYLVLIAAFIVLAAVLSSMNTSASPDKIEYPRLLELIEEGNASKIFNSRYPMEAAEMIMIYANTAFDTLAAPTPEEMQRKSMAFICHTERILGAKEGSMQEAIMKIFAK